MKCLVLGNSIRYRVKKNRSRKDCGIRLGMFSSFVIRTYLQFVYPEYYYSRQAISHG